MICLNENCLLVDYLGTFVLSSFMVSPHDDDHSQTM